ncbi:MAG TPA: HAMP domain-containing sensor histidine kinase [Candidatus Dormibacteraeota bacterium]|nr:HAMP domain-containing sensor histidine kinase [Candidatus Dormibacteraeota bacterium]
MRYSPRMASVLQALDLVVQVAFVALAVFTLADWIRHRDRLRLWLVVALVSLSGLAVLAPVAAYVGLPGQLQVDAALVLFVLSGYALLMFRDSLLPLGVRLRAAITVWVVVVAAIGVTADLSSNPVANQSGYQAAALGLIVATWVVCVIEPILRLGLASIGRPSVEGSRLRSLSLGYAGLVAVIVVSTVAAPVVQSTSARIITNAVVLLIVPLLYASFAPPLWLRQLWSRPEEEWLRGALHELLLYSPDRPTLAARALAGGARMVGAPAGFIEDADGSILAAHGLTKKEALEIAAKPHGGHSTLRIPLDLTGGQGMITILSGPITPLFGDWEISRLRGFAVSITAGLDRVSATARIAALEKAKTEFLDFASHELRGPMTVIKGYLTMIGAGSLGDVPPKAAAVVPLLIAKADEVNSMLEQMIETSRLEEGRLALKKERSDIAELTEEALQNLGPLVSDHEVDVHRPPQPLWADVDPDRFQIVIRNLVTNAVKYSPSGTPVAIAVSRQNDHARISVKDSGIGIDKEDQRNLFTRFGRIESQATARTPGAGLGLWLSREIARMHDGDLTVESEPGKGSTFTLEIPLHSD